MSRTATCMALLTAVSCSAPTVDLDGRPCDANDKCLPGYTCDFGVCVLIDARCELGRVDTCGTCEQDCAVQVQNATPACRAGADDEFDCDYDGTCASGFHDADLERSNGCECSPSGAEVCDNIDNDCDGHADLGVPSCQCATQLPSAEICDGIDNDCNQDIDDTFPCSGSDIHDCDAGTGPTSGSEVCNDIACDWSGICVEKDFDPPGQVLVTTVGLNGAVQLDWTYPVDTDLSQCVIRRKTSTAPTGHDDGDLVREINNPTPGTGDTYTDTGVSNGTLYYYGVYCRDLSGNWQNLATTDSALPVAPPPANPDNVIATGGDGIVYVTFTTPASTFSECLLVRKVGRAPADHEDIDNSLGTFTAAARPEIFNDDGVSNGVTYFYAVFCNTDGTWNDNAITDANVAEATPRAPSDCLPADTVSFTEMPRPCAHHASLQGNAVVMGLIVQTDCANTVTGLRIHRHGASTVDTELSNFRLFLDADDSNSLNKGDTPVGLASAGAIVAFNSLNINLPVDTPVGLLVVADVGTVGARPLFVAWEVRDASDIELSDADQGISLAGGELVSTTTTLNSGRCDGTGGAASDLGPGTFGSSSVMVLQGPGNTSGWGAGAGDETTWSPVGADFNNATADCVMITAGTPNPVYVSDTGNDSAFLHVNTGIPLGLPLCGLDMRVYGTEYDANGTCTLNQLSSFQDAYTYFYVSTTAVAGEITLGITATAGPAVGGASCNSHFADFDLSTLYGAASANVSAEDPFNIRLIFEDGGGIGASGGIQTTVPELFFRISP